MSDRNDMLPCPHCGSNNVDPAFSRGYDAGNMTQPVIAAGCMDCGASGPSVKVPDHSTGYEVATKAWNNRQSQQARGDPVAWRVTNTETGDQFVLGLKDPERYKRNYPEMSLEPCFLAPSAPAAAPEVTPEMLRAAQINSELGAYVASNWAGAYDVITELFTVMASAQKASNQ